MNKDQTREMALLMLDWADGKCEVEYGKEGKWMSLPENPRWLFETWDYRRKPIPKHRPFEVSELVGLIGKEVSEGDIVYEIESFEVGRDGVMVTLKPQGQPLTECIVTPKRLRNSFKFVGGGPCGVEE